MSIASNLSLIQDIASNTYLGSATNVIIYGGISGQFLTTNGSGGLYWSTSTGGTSSGSVSNITSSSSLATVSISDTAPSNPFTGQLWWDSSVGNLVIYYTDPDSSQWVDAVGSFLFPSSVPSLNVAGTFTVASTTTAFIGGAAIITSSTIGLYAAANVASSGTTATVFIVSSTATNTYSTNSGAFQVVGGVGIGGSAYIGSTLTSTSTTTGALVVNGGVGIGGALYANNSVISSTATSTSTTTGALIVTGGVGIGGNLYVGGSIYSGGNLIGTTLISDTPPSSPYAGMLWWDSSIGNLAIYYTDADSSQWVDAVNTVASGGTSSSSSSSTNVTISDTAPNNPTNGQLWWDSSVGNLAIYYSSSTVWVDAVNSLATPNFPNTFGFKNRIINGAMRIAQRSTSTTITAGGTIAAGYALVDRFYIYSTGGNVTVAQVAGTSPVLNNLQITGGSGVTAVGVGQRIEAQNSADLAGSVCTLSVNLSNSLLTSVTWTAYYATTADTFGTLASPTRTQIANGTWTVYSSFVNYTAQITVPSAATTGIEIVFTVGAQISGTWVIGNVQLEKGGSATAFDYRSYQTELSLCQRYYEKSYPIGISPGTVTSYGAEVVRPATTEANFYVKYKVTKRNTATNSISYSETTGASNRIRQIDGTSSPQDVTVQYGYFSDQGFRIYGTIGSAGAFTTAQWTSDNEL